MFRKYNPNPKGNKAADCVIRAFTKVLGKDWDTIYLELAKVGFKLKRMPNENTTYAKYAEENGLERCKVELVDRKKPTVEEFAQAHPSGTYLLRVARHLVAVVDGSYYDTWDSGDKSVYMYWRKKD